MGFWAELFTHTGRLFRVQFRKRRLFVGEVFQMCMFCCLIVIIRALFDARVRKKNKVNVEGTLTSLELWFYPDSNDTMGEIQKVVEGMNFATKLKEVKLREFASWQDVIDEGIDSFGHLRPILIVEFNDSSDVRFTLRTIEGFRADEIFTFLTGAYGAEGISIETVPMPCSPNDSFQSVIIILIIFTCFVAGWFVAYSVGRERSHNTDNCITWMRGNLAAYILSWYLQLIIKTLCVTVLYFIISFPFTFDASDIKIFLASPIPYILFRHIIEASFTTATLLIRNGWTAVTFMTLWHLYSLLFEQYFSCFSDIKWWTVFIPKLGCQCIFIDSKWNQNHHVWPCFISALVCYLLCIIFGCLALIPPSFWKRPECFCNRIKIDTDVKIIKEAGSDEGRRAAITVKSVPEMPSLLPSDFVLKVPSMRITVLLETFGSVGSCLLNTVVGQKCCPNNAVLVMDYGLTICYCPSDDILWDQLTVKEVFNVFAKFSNSHDYENIIKDFDLQDFLDTPIQELSEMDRKMVMLAATFLSYADILVFEDPTRILKGKALKVFIACVRRRRGLVTVLMTCSNARDAVRMADRVGVLVGGTIRLFGSVPFVNMCLGVGTHIKVTLVSNENLSTLLFYLWMYVPHSVSLPKLNTEKTNDEGNEMWIYNYFVGQHQKKNVEYVVLYFQSKQSEFGISEIHATDVGINTILDRCQSSLMLELLLHSIYQHSVPIHAMVEGWNEDSIIDDEILKYTSPHLQLPSKESLDVSELNLADIKPAYSDISFSEFVNIMTQRFHVRQNLDGDEKSSGTTAEYETNSETTAFEEQTMFQRWFAYWTDANSSKKTSDKHNKNDNNSTKNSNSRNNNHPTRREHRSTHCTSTRRDSHQTSSTSSGGSYNCNNNSTHSNNDYNSNAGQARKQSLHQISQLFSHQSSSSSSGSSSYDESTIDEEERDMARYCDLLFWGNVQQQNTAPKFLLKGSEISIRDFETCRVLGTHTKALLWMIFLHLWQYKLFILVGFCLALLIENAAFILSWSRMDHAISLTQPQDVKDYARTWRDDFYYEYEKFDPTSCNHYSCSKTEAIYCNSRVFLHGYLYKQQEDSVNSTVNNANLIGKRNAPSNGIIIYYSTHGDLDYPKLLSTAMAMEHIQENHHGISEKFDPSRQENKKYGRFYFFNDHWQHIDDISNPTQDSQQHINDANITDSGQGNQQSLNDHNMTFSVQANSRHTNNSNTTDFGQSIQTGDSIPDSIEYSRQHINDSYNITDYIKRIRRIVTDDNLTDSVQLNASNEDNNETKAKRVKTHSVRKTYSVYVDPLPLELNETTRLLARKLRVPVAKAVVGNSFSAICLLLSISFGFGGVTLRPFYKLLLLSGVNSFLLYFTQVMSCFFLHFILTSLVNATLLLMSVILNNNWSHVWTVHNDIMFIVANMTYSLAVFSSVNLFLHVTSKKIWLLIWTWFEMSVFVIGHASSLFQWWWVSGGAKGPYLLIDMALLCISPTKRYMLSCHYLLHHTVMEGVMLTHSRYNIYNTTRLNIRNVMGCSDDKIYTFCARGKQDMVFVTSAIDFTHVLYCIIMLGLMRMNRLKKMKQKKTMSSPATPKAQDPNSLNLSGLTVHPKYHVNKQKDLLFASCRPMHCVSLYGNEDSGVSSIIQLIIGQDPYSGRNVNIGGQYFPQPNWIIIKQRLNVGFCPKKEMLHPFLTARQILKLFAQIRCASSDLNTEINKLLGNLALTDVADNQIYKYSDADKRRLQLGVALVGKPSILLLDHPTRGLDYLERVSMWDFLIRRRHAGHMILMASDNAEECSSVGTYAYVMRAGRILFKSNMLDVRQQSTGYFVYVWMIQDEKGNHVPVVRILREIQRQFRSGLFSMVENVREPYLVFSFPHIIPEFEHSKIYSAMEDFKAAGLVRNYLVSEITPAIVLDAYATTWYPL